MKAAVLAGLVLIAGPGWAATAPDLDAGAKRFMALSAHKFPLFDGRHNRIDPVLGLIDSNVEHGGAHCHKQSAHENGLPITFEHCKKPPRKGQHFGY